MKEWHLKKGHKYNIFVTLNLLESYAWNGVIEDKFKGHGFTVHEVFGEGKSRTVIGTWNGEDTLFSDKHISNVEEL